MKKVLLILMSLMFLATPTFAANTTVEAVTVDLSPKGAITSRYSYFDVVNLTEGLYAFKVIGTGLGFDQYSLNAFVSMFDSTGTAFLGSFGLSSGVVSGHNNFNYSQLFRVPDLTNFLFVLDVNAWAAYGSKLSFTASIERVAVPVPGPEAGAGLGALAMAGIAYLAMRRRRSLSV